MEVLNTIIQFLVETPFEELLTYGLVLFGWPPIAGVFIWGLIQVWQDYKQTKYAIALKWKMYRIQIPANSIQTPKGMENFFNLIAGSKSTITWKENWLQGKFQPWFVLEIVSEGGRISFYIRTQVKYDDMVVGAIYAQYPEAQVIEMTEDYAQNWPEKFPNDETDAWGSMMVAKAPNFMPIKTYIDFEHQGEKDQRFKDPLLVILEQMGRMKPDETYAIQILIMAVTEQDDWRKPGLAYLEEKFGRKQSKSKGGTPLDQLAWIPAEMINQVSGGALGLGGSEDAAAADDFAMFKLNSEDQETVRSVARKISKIGWLTKIRFVYFSSKESYRKGSIASMTKGMFHLFGNLSTNKLGLYDPTTPKDDYFWMEWQMDGKKESLLQGYKYRSWGRGSNPYILNSEELATIFHFPAADARTPVLSAPPAKMGEAPMELQFVDSNTPTIPYEDPEKKRQSAIPKIPQPLAVPRPMAPVQGMPQPVVPEPPAQPAPPAPSLPPAPPAVPVSASIGAPAPLARGVDEPLPLSDIGGAPPNLPI
jgi:hypothetical protein